MNVDDILFHIFNHLDFQTLFLNCFRVCKNWNQIVELVIQSKKQCCFFEWQITDYLLSQNENSVLSFYKSPRFDRNSIFMAKRGLFIDIVDADDRYYVQFFTHFNRLVEFELKVWKESRFLGLTLFPQQSFLHHLDKDNLIVVHMGYHDEGSDEIEYHCDFVFDYKNLANIKTNCYKTIELENQSGRCGICSRYCQKTTLLPVATKRMVVGYGRNIFRSPLTMINEHGKLRTVEFSSFHNINIYENDQILNSFGRNNFSIEIVDSDHIFLWNCYLRWAEIINVVSGQSYHMATKDLVNVNYLENFLFVTSAGHLFMRQGVLWRMIRLADDSVVVDSKSFSGAIPVFCEKENKIHVF